LNNSFVKVDSNIILGHILSTTLHTTSVHAETIISKSFQYLAARA